MPSAQNRHPWERLPAKAGNNGTTESRRNYQAFQAYLELPTGNRIIEQLAQDLKIGSALLHRWSSDFDWPARAEAWENYQARLEQERYETENQALRRLWQARRKNVAEDRFRLAQNIKANSEILMSLASLQDGPRHLNTGPGKMHVPTSTIFSIAMRMSRFALELEARAITASGATKKQTEEADVFNFVDYKPGTRESEE